MLRESVFIVVLEIKPLIQGILPPLLIDRQWNTRGTATLGAEWCRALGFHNRGRDGFIRAAVRVAVAIVAQRELIQLFTLCRRILAGQARLT